MNKYNPWWQQNAYQMKTFFGQIIQSHWCLKLTLSSDVIDPVAIISERSEQFGPLVNCSLG